VRFYSLRSFKENATVLGKKVEGNAFVITDRLSESRAGGAGDDLYGAERGPLQPKFIPSAR